MDNDYVGVESRMYKWLIGYQNRTCKSSIDVKRDSTLWEKFRRIYFEGKEFQFGGKGMENETKSNGVLWKEYKGKIFSPNPKKLETTESFFIAYFIFKIP